MMVKKTQAFPSSSDNRSQSSIFHIYTSMQIKIKKLLWMRLLPNAVIMLPCSQRTASGGRVSLVRKKTLN